MQSSPEILSDVFAFKANLANTVPDGSITADKFAPNLLNPLDCSLSVPTVPATDNSGLAIARLPPNTTNPVVRIIPGIPDSTSAIDAIRVLPR